MVKLIINNSHYKIYKNKQKLYDQKERQYYYFSAGFGFRYFFTDDDFIDQLTNQLSKYYNQHLFVISQPNYRKLRNKKNYYYECCLSFIPYNHYFNSIEKLSLFYERLNFWENNKIKNNDIYYTEISYDHSETDGEEAIRSQISTDHTIISERGISKTKLFIKLKNKEDLSTLKLIYG